MISRTNAVLAGLLVVVLAMTTIARVDHSKPNFEVLPDMKYTPAWPAFAANPNFANGRTMQAPVPGTIARGAMPLHYSATKEDAVRAGEALKNPFAIAEIDLAVKDGETADVRDDPPENRVIADDIPAADGNTPAADGTPKETPKETPEAAAAKRLALAQARRAASVARGGDTYRVFCISCHGPTGLGDGPVPKRGFPPPPSMLTGKSVQMKDGQLFHILTYGQASMASFAAQLSHEQRWDVINYVRELQSSATTNDANLTAPEPASETATGETATGETATDETTTDETTTDAATTKDAP